MKRNGLSFDIPKQGETLPEAKIANSPKAERVKRVCDPRLVSAARELRDRWLEQVNGTPLIRQGKYEISRQIIGTIEVGPSLAVERVGQIEYQQSNAVAA